MAKRSDGIVKVDDIDEKEFLSILDGRSTPSALPSKEKREEQLREIENEKKKAEKQQQEQQEQDEQETEETMPSEQQKIYPEQKPLKQMSKRKQGEYYEGLFLQPRELKIRQCVYISRVVHETVADIVKRIGERGLTVGVYIDTILQQHLQEHKDEINSLYCKPTDKIIK